MSTTINTIDFALNGITGTIRENYGWTADTDSYKLTHAPQYPKNAVRMMSYGESRGGTYDKVIWFGLQLIIKEFLLQPLTHKMVDNIIAFEKSHLMGLYTEELEVALRAVVDEYDGKLPVTIRSADEGLVIPVKNILFSIESSVDDERIFHLVSYIEGKIMRVWAPTTTATKSWHIRKYLEEQLMITLGNINPVPFMLHDFGSRGVSAFESACFTGAGHLVSFSGSDTVGAVLATNIGYHAEMSAFSIPASEHSTTTMHGRDGEEKLVEQMFNRFAKPGAIFATVIDSYDWKNFVTKIAPKFKARLFESGAKWVFRPDSGDAIKTPVKVVELLDEVFGHTINDNGYKVLNSVAVIQGDGIEPKDVKLICELLISKGYCVSNMAFGMGGGLLQKQNRDTLKFAIKCCAHLSNGTWVDVYKKPAIYDIDTMELLNDEESTFKESKRGRLELYYNPKTGEYRTIPLGEKSITFDNLGWKRMLNTVYKDGELIRDFTLDEVRANAGTL